MARPFHVELTHPVVELANHVVSPLTASLTIFGVHKMWQVPAARAWWTAVGVLARAGRWRELAPRPGTLTLGLGLSMGAAAVCASSWELTAPAPPRPSLHHALSRLYSPEDAPLVAAHLSSAPTVLAVERRMTWLHEVTHVPWWGVIVGVTLGLRIALAPLNVSLLRNSLRMKVIMPQVGSLSAEIHTSGAPQEASRRLLALFRTAGCHPLKHLVSFTLLLPPTILSLFGAIHNLSVSAPGMEAGGGLWFPDLIAPDVSHLLPIASAVTWLMNVEAGAGVHYHATPHLRSAVRIAAVTCWPLASTLPNGVLLFWVTSNVFALARAAATKPDAVRRMLRIPLRSEIAALAHLPKPLP